ncbi:MAG: single-stranded DNA-binding protein, partial [Kiritimatiellaeota bacterium]|nr:single-stranded DNA-binding protein [Kiritimatiellota bacterium]
MASLNRVFLIGNLTRDPELRYTTGGAAVCNLGLAVNRRYTTSQGEDREEVCFVDIEVWGKQAEICKQYLSKGAPAFVEGRLRYDSWDDRDTGRKRS